MKIQNSGFIFRGFRSSVLAIKLVLLAIYLLLFTISTFLIDRNFKPEYFFARDVELPSTGHRCFDMKLDSQYVITNQPRKSRTDFLTIGISTVRRQNNDTYLQQTLSSLLNNTTPAELKNVTFVIFLADFNATYNIYVQNRIEENFNESVRSGLIHIIQATRNFYPSMRNLQSKYDDNADRIYWRSKQVLDYAFMFAYLHDTSTYHIQLEDDIICAPGYLTTIRNMTNQYPATDEARWGTVSFSNMGFIGKLVRGSYLLEMSAFFRLFYSEMPTDWLIHQYMLIKDKMEVYPYMHVFQHMGIHSSLANKTQLIKDRKFGTGNGVDNLKSILLRKSAKRKYFT